MVLQYTWKSVQGTLTEDNRDYCGIAHRSDATLYIVVDGATSGPSSGKLAKQLVHRLVDKFCESVQPVTNFSTCGLLKEIHEEMRASFHSGSTSYFILIQKEDGSILTLHAGDCRLGAVKQKKIDWLSQPHTLANAIEKLGDIELAAHPGRHYLTQSFSFKKPFEIPEHNQFPDLSRDVLILATDGFWAELTTGQQMGFLEDATLFSEEKLDDRSYLLLRNKSADNAEKLLKNFQEEDNLYIRQRSSVN